MATNQTNGTATRHQPALNIPRSSTVIDVKMIDVSTIAGVSADALFQPPAAGFSVISPAPSLVFLLEHPSGSKVLFDLGIRKDWENLASDVVDRIKQHEYNILVEKGISEVLEDSAIGKDTINAVIWSHAHWDHMGDMSTFNSTTDLVVGPGFKDHYLGENKGNSALGGVLPSDLEGRALREIIFEGPNALQIGQFSAYDYFNDGSLYLIDSPGHCIGHLCALVRTTTNPDTFVFLGGDAAHHCGEYRPSAYCPMPEAITPNPVTMQEREIPFCPGSWFQDLQLSRHRDPNGPLFYPAFGHNMDQVLDTIAKMQEYDAQDNDILIILAHDAAFRLPQVPKFPEKLNDWKKQGLGKDLRWAWIGDIWPVTHKVNT